MIFGFWEPDRQVERRSLPNVGTIVADITRGRFEGKEYDKELYERLKGALC